MDATTTVFEVAPGPRFNVTTTSSEIERHPTSYYDTADLVWMMTCSALVFLMIPGLGLHYSGTSKRASVHMIWMPIITSSVVGLVWFLWGYAIAFSPSGSGMWGGSTGVTFRDVLVRPVGNPRGPQIPELVYALYQGMFACFTAAVVTGATIYKQKTWRWLTFAVLWVTLVYCPIAHSSWNPKGFANRAGALDFAGGTPVHITAGTSALAYSLFFRLQVHRYNRYAAAKNLTIRPEHNWVHRQEEREDDVPPLHVPTLTVGTVMLWLGWFGFNGGSALGANMRAVSAILSTQLAACAGGVSAAFLEDIIYAKLRMWAGDFAGGDRKMTGEVRARYKRPIFPRMVVSFCTGAVAGMVAVTPAAGYISPRFAPLFGLLGAVSSSYAVRLSKYLFDTLDIFAIHTVSGFVGMVMTAFFADARIVALDGYDEIQGGFVNHHWEQIGIQLIDAIAAMAYAFSVTFLILCLLNIHKLIKTPEKPKIVYDWNEDEPASARYD